MKMDKGMDTGDILLTEKVPLDETMTAPRLLEILTEVGTQALLKALPLYREGKLHPTPQPQEGVTYADKLRKEEGFLDWTLSASLLERKVRALNPWPGTWFMVGQDRIKVFEAKVLPLHSSFPPGTVLDSYFTIACSEGSFRPLKVQKVGKSVLTAADFLRGYELPPVLVNEAI